MGRGYCKDKGDEILKNNNQTANKKTKKDDDEGTLNKQSVASSHSGMFAPLFTANN